MATRVVYRIYDCRNALLYVGATTNPSVRFKTHSGTQKWWPSATTITLEHFATVEEMNAAEIAAIQSEKPLHNRIHSDNPWRSGGRRNPDEPGVGVFQRGDGMWVGSVEVLPGTDGKRRQKRVYSKDKDEAVRKLAALKVRLTAAGEL